MTMMSCPVGADLSTWSRHEWTDGVQLETMPALTTLVVRTRNSTYEITVVSPHTADVLVRGGAFFPAATRTCVAGSSLGGSFLKRRGIYVGFQMELHDGQRTIITTRVRSIGRVSNQQIH